jgi:hypothetical protein
MGHGLIMEDKARGPFEEEGCDRRPVCGLDASQSFTRTGAPTNCYESASWQVLETLPATEHDGPGSLEPDGALQHGIAPTR